MCREMRADPLIKNVPILFLTAKTKDEDKIAGFMAGADDYLVEPFNVDELILRIRAIIRKAKRQTQFISSQDDINAKIAQFQEPPEIRGPPRDEKLKYQIVIGKFSLNVRTFELFSPYRGKIRLTPVQFDLLYQLNHILERFFRPFVSWMRFVIICQMQAARIWFVFILRISARGSRQIREIRNLFRQLLAMDIQSIQKRNKFNTYVIGYAG
jgi:hypothetical protein